MNNNQPKFDKINRSILAMLYKISRRTLYDYLLPHEYKLEKMATKRRTKSKRIAVSPHFNSKQLEYIVEHVLKDTPEGYTFNGQTFIPLNE